jgi:C4-dicarboxylate transporter DctQ subunit
LPPLARRITTGLALIACLAFSIMLLIGAWHYWLPFATDRAWLETEDIPMPELLQFLADWVNEGERYENLPRMIPYLALPLGMALLTFRFLQLGWQLMRGQLDMIICSHENEGLQQQTDSKSDKGESCDPWKP